MKVITFKFIYLLGFESKAVKYGEDEETFSLQRAETGDHRINKEHQSNHIDQNKDLKFNNQRIKTNSNNNNNNRNNNNDNSEKDIFKGSSSSNFFNNRNNGKERDEDYDDNVNVNQDRDYESRRKVVRNRSRRPVQQNNRQAQQNSDSNNEYNSNDNYNRNNDDNNRNNDYNRNNNYNRNSDNNRNKDSNRNRNSDFEAKKTDNQEQQNRRTIKPVDFTNNYAGSSYLPTTAKPSSTTLNSEQYTTAVNNYRTRNGQRRPYTPEYEASSTPVYTVSTPAPFKQTQQYNNPPSRPANSPVTENYPQQKLASKSTTAFDEHYDIPKIKPSTVAENYNAQYDTQKTKQTASTAAQTYNTQYDVSKTKQTPTPFSTQYDVPKSKSTSVDQTYETTKVKQNNFVSKTTPYDKTENYPSNNPAYISNFDKKTTTPLKQSDNYPTTYSPKPFSNFPTTFSPRTNSGYTEIAHQTISYTKNTQSSAYTQYSSSQAKNNSPKSTNGGSNVQYTPTVPKAVSTTPVTR